MNKLLIALGLSTVLLGCSSNGDQEKQLGLLATNRASILQSKLPIKLGPLSVMRASAKGHMIELMMIYNTGDPKAKSIQSVLETSINSYCTQPETKSNMDAGIVYRIKMRNTRGQLVIDQQVSKETCNQSKSS